MGAFPLIDPTNGNPLLKKYQDTGVIPEALKPVLGSVQQKLQALGSSVTPPAGATATLQPPQPAPPPLTAPRETPMLSAGGNPTPAKREYNRLTHVLTPEEKAAGLEHTKLDTGAPGWQQIHNPFLRNTVGVLDAIGSAVFPALTTGLPGTRLHHQLLVNEARGNVNEEQDVAKDEAQTHHFQAQAAEQESLPEFHNAQNDLRTAQNEINQRKQAETETSHRNTEDIRRARNEGQQTEKQQAQEINDRKAGYRRNAEGDLEAIPYGEMTLEHQVEYDLKSSQREVADATAALRMAQAAKIPKNEDLARQRLDIANRRLALSQATYNARYFGTGPDNKPLPGSMITDDDRSVGTANAQNVRPTGTERTRADLATSGREQLKDMQEIVKKHPEYFGPGAGRVTAFKNWIGSEDPEAKRFMTARNTLAEHGSGVFGARSEAAATANAIASGELKDNPAAILAALGQLDKAMGTIQSKGVVKTTGSNAAKEAQGNVVEYERDSSGKLVPKKAAK